MAAPPFEAVVLAAGAGRRLAAHTASTPKVLVPVAGRPILLRLLDQLGALGATRITIVVGAFADVVRKTLQESHPHLPIEFVENVDWATTNNSVSLACCAAALTRGCVLVEGDVVAETSVLQDFLAAPAPTAWAVRHDTPEQDGAFLTAGADGRLAELRIVRRGEPRGSGAKSLGILRFSPEYGRRLAGWLEAELQAGRRDRYYDVVVADHLREEAPVLVPIERGFWTEIDTPEDLSRADASFGAS